MNLRNRSILLALAASGVHRRFYAIVRRLKTGAAGTIYTCRHATSPVTFFG